MTPDAFLADLHVRRLDYGRIQGHAIELFEGPCQLTSCLTREPHYHALCPSCEAASYQNATCYSCKRARDGSGTCAVRAGPVAPA